MKRINFLFLTVLSLFIYSCSSSSSSLAEGDPDIEAKFDGTWTSTFTYTDYEDGEESTSKTIEIVTYNSTTHEYECSLDCYIITPVRTHLCTVTYKGEWSADKETLSEKPDIESVKFTFHTGLLDKNDKEEFKDGFMSEVFDKEKCNSEIRKISKNSFTIYDGEDEMTYTRK